MGMLGAMAGAGQGLVDYADTLKLKDKQDWEARQESVKHERAMNMQKLADSNADARQKNQQGFLSGESALTRGQQDKQFGVTSGLQQGQLDESIRSNKATAAYQDKALTVQERMAEDQRVANAALQEDRLKAGAKEGEADRASRIDQIKLTASENRITLSDTQAGELANYKAKATADLDSKIEATNTLLTKMKATDGFKMASKPLQGAMELQALVNGKLDFTDLAKSPGVSISGEALKGPTAKQMELSIEQLGKSETFNRMDAAQQWNMAQAKAIILANPSLANTAGSVVIPDGDLVKAAKAWNEGKMDGNDILRLSPDSLSKVVDLANQMKAIPSVPDRKASAGNVGLLRGTKEPEVNSEFTPSGISGRQFNDFIGTIFSGDPLKRNPEDVGTMNQAQIDAANVGN